MEKINKRAQLKSGDILFTSLIPIGNLYLIHDYYSNYGINESVFSLRAKIKIISSNWLYLILNEEYFKKFTKKEASGSLQKSIKIDDLLNCQVLLPKQEYIKQFSKMIDSLFEKAILIENKLNLLKKAKQFLLPLLLNGQIN